MRDGESPETGKGSIGVPEVVFLAAIVWPYIGELCTDAGRKQAILEAPCKGKNAFQEMGMDYWLAKTEKALEKFKER
jgi:hypothetical protein